MAENFCQSEAMTSLLTAIEQSRGPLVFVSNEIGLGVVPVGAGVRAYVDALGWLNQQVAARCQRACLMVAGQPLWLKRETQPAVPADVLPDGAALRGHSDARRDLAGHLLGRLSPGTAVRGGSPVRIVRFDDRHGRASPCRI